MRPAVAVCGTVAFLGILAAYVALVLTGNDPSGLGEMVLMLLSVLGLGAHVEHRTQQQNATIAKIDRQTNGVLDQRIHDGTSKAVAAVLAEHNLIPPAQ